MCTYDKTYAKTSDCGRCFCGTSNKYGVHNWTYAGTVTVGGISENTYKCTMCGTYK